MREVGAWFSTTRRFASVPLSCAAKRQLEIPNSNAFCHWDDVGATAQGARRHEGRRRKGLRRRLRMFHVKPPFSCAPPFPARDRTASGAGDTSSSRHHPLLHVELMIAQAFHEFEVVEDAEHRGAFGFQLLDEGAHLELRRVVERGRGLVEQPAGAGA